MANVSIENNGAQHVALAAPIKLVGALDLCIDLIFSLTLHSKLTPQWDSEWFSLTQMIVGATSNVELHHSKDPIFH
jgi:hypothetical protein